MDCGANRSLQAAAQELERQRAADSLKKGLEKRPAREDLVERMSYSCLRPVCWKFAVVAIELEHTEA
jgi:hypothetical protein